MKIGISADWHVDSYGHRIDPASGLSARLMDYLRTATWVASESRRRGCDALVVAGDMTESRHPSPWLVARLQEALLEGPERVIVTRGNHDGAKGGRSIVDVFDAMPGWDGVDRPRVLRIGDLAICCMGYVDRTWARTQPGLETAPDADVFRLLADTYLAMARGLFAEAMAGGASRAILVGHQSLGGGRMSETQQAFLGDLSLVVDSHALAAVGYSLVAFGHYHRGQTVIDDPSCPVVYPGSIERVDFAEENEPKSFLVVDVPESGPVSIEWVETPARRFVTIEGDDLGDEPVDVEGAIVRVRDLPPDHDPVMVRRDLEQRGAFEVHSIERRRVEASVLERGLAESLSPAEALDAYFAEDDDRDALVERGRDLIGAAA